MKDILLALFCALLLVLAFGVALHSIDNITKRDCARGITSACQYVK